MCRDCGKPKGIAVAEKATPRGPGLAPAPATEGGGRATMAEVVATPAFAASPAPATGLGAPVAGVGAERAARLRAAFGAAAPTALAVVPAPAEPPAKPLDEATEEFAQRWGRRTAAIAAPACCALGGFLAGHEAPEPEPEDQDELADDVKSALIAFAPRVATSPLGRVATTCAFLVGNSWLAARRDKKRAAAEKARDALTAPLATNTTTPTGPAGARDAGQPTIASTPAELLTSTEGGSVDA